MSELAQKFLETLLQTQFLAPERMLAYQRRLLERLVRHARATVPYYRDSGRLDALFTADDRIDWERWEEIPILTRSEAQANSEALYADTVPPECGSVLTGHTSGSTGKPMVYRVNTLMGEASTAALERAFVWAGLPAQLTLAWIHYVKSVVPGPLGAAFQSRIRGTDRLMHQVPIEMPVEQQGRWLAAFRPDVVMSWPGALAQLAKNLPPELNEHRFQLVICLGEVASASARAEIEQGFRCPTMDLYTGSEFGAVAVEDRNLKQMLICEEIIRVEFREQTGYASENENLAELIFTPFYNYAMPLIRYATGDYAVIDREPSPDRRTLRRMERIVGRQRNLFILPSGKSWWPALGTMKSFGEWLDFDQIQFAQTQRGRVELRFISRDPQPVKNAERLIALLQSAVPEPIEFVLRHVPEIPRHRSGKYDDFVCEIDTATT